jgi:hypothetical protein
MVGLGLISSSQIRSALPLLPRDTDTQVDMTLEQQALTARNIYSSLLMDCALMYSFQLSISKGEGRSRLSNPCMRRSLSQHLAVAEVSGPSTLPEERELYNTEYYVPRPPPDITIMSIVFNIISDRH